MRNLALFLLTLSCSLGLFAKVLISEIAYDAKKPFKSDDWVEICNYGTNDVDVSGWQLGDDKYDEGGKIYTLPADTVLKPKECLVIYSAADFASVYPDVKNAYGPSGIGYGKTDDSVVLLNENGKVKCEIKYETMSEGGDWPDGSTFSNVLRFPYGDYPEDWQCWCVSDAEGGTPGTWNPETCGLAVTKHSRNPNAPTTVTQPEIHIWAYDKLSESTQVQSCVISFSDKEDGEYQSAAMTKVEGNEWKYVFPAKAAGEKVFYYATVKDAAGSSLRKNWNLQKQPYMYVVTDSPVYSGVVINEIMYHCLETAYTNTKGNCKNYEFVEFYNRTAEALDLSYWRFETETAKLRLPEGTTLAPDSYLVLTDRKAAMDAVYSVPAESQVIEMDFKLDNGGEAISLQNCNGQEVDRVAYDDEDPWPVAPDGLGPSLELMDPDSDNSKAAAWGASEAVYGTPGAINSIFVPEPALTMLGLGLLFLVRRRG